MRRFFLILGVAVLLLPACHQEVPPPPLPVAPAIAPTSQARLVVDTQRSVIRWKGTKFWGLGKHEGIIRLASGHLDVAGQTITGGAFVIDMHSIEITDIPKSDPVPRNRLRDHLLHEDFFAADTYPTARFVLTNVTPGDGATRAVSGALTMRGRTHPVTFDATISALSEQAVRATARFTINRQHWGVAYRGSRLTNDLVDDDIHLDLVLIAAP